MEVLESPNNLDGEIQPEEPVTEGESPSTISELLGTEPITESITDDLSSTTISGDPLNVTESFMNLTETFAVGNETELDGEGGVTVNSFTGFPPFIAENNTEEYADNDSIKNEESFDSLILENTPEWSPASVQNGPIPTLIQFASTRNNFSLAAALHNESDVFLKTLDLQDTGNFNLSFPSITTIKDRYSSINGSIPYQIMNYASILPDMLRFNDTNSSQDRETPRISPVSLESIVPQAVAYAPVMSPDLPVNDFNKTRLYSLPVGIVVQTTNSTLPASKYHREDLNEQLGSSTQNLPPPSQWFRGKPPINSYAYGGPSLHKQDFEPRKGSNVIKIALSTSTPTTVKPMTTTTKKSGFRLKTVLKKSKVKPTRKPKVRKVVKKTPKTIKSKPAASFRSGRKVRTVVKRRFRKVVRRATTTRLVFRRRRRTTRLVRKTTTARLLTTAKNTGNEHN